MNNEEALRRKNRNIGILFILMSAMGFACMNLCVRMSGDLPTYQKIFFRNLVAVIYAGYVLAKNGGGFRWGKGNFKYLMLRSITGTVGLVANYYAVDRMNISDASLLNKMSPFFAVFFSWWILKEKPAKMDWAAIGLALLGAVFVVKPTAGIASFPALFALAGGITVGCAFTYVRLLGMRGERSAMTIFFFSAFSTVLVAPAAILFGKPMSPAQFGWLLAAGICATVGQVGLTEAYTHAPAKEVGVFDYSQVIFAAILGFFFLQQTPDILSLIGYVIIIGTGIMKWKYNLTH